MKRDGCARLPVHAMVRCTGLLLCLALSACTSHELRCEGKLEPINPPAPPSAASRADPRHDE